MRSMKCALRRVICLGPMLAMAVLSLGVASAASSAGSGQASPAIAAQQTEEETQTLEAASEAGDNLGLSAKESDAGSDRFAHDLKRYPNLDVPKKPWSYTGHYFFYLTRGLSENDLPAWEQGASMLGTVPLDLVGLPFAALAGFYGS